MFTTQLKTQVYQAFKRGILTASAKKSQAIQSLILVKRQPQLLTQWVSARSNSIVSQVYQQQPQVAYAHTGTSSSNGQVFTPEEEQLLNSYGFTIWNTEGGDDKKPPKGFEKFFKKKEEREKEASQPSKGKGDEEKEQRKEAAPSTKKDEEERISEDEGDQSSSSSGGKKGDDNEDKKKDEEKSWKKFFFDEDNNPKPEGFLALLLSGFAGYYLLTYKKPMQELVYMDFLNNYLLKNNVKEINITKDRRSEVFNYRAEVVTNSGEKLYMVLGSYESFLAKLDMVQREMGRNPAEFIPVKYTNQSEESTGTFMMNMLIGSLFVLFFYQIYKAGRGGKGLGGKGTGSAGKDAGKDKGNSWFQGGKGGMNDMFNYGKSNATVFGEDKKIKTRFKDVAGNENAKVEIMEFVDFLKDPKKYQKLGARVPRGALLVGPPGCGKTLLAKAVAGESKVPFLTISGSDFVEMFVGVGASRVRDLFKKARQKAPSIIFIDEIDAVGKKRHGKMGGGNDERDNTLNQLLVEMDGFTTDTSVIVLAATNRQDTLDSALLRPGRFDRTIEITLPSIQERDQIFNVHLKKIKLNEKLPREEYARKMSALTPGFSGADLRNICNEAAIIAARKSLESVSIKEFEEATERVIAGIEKKLPLSDLERRTVAFHEAGHAVAGWFLKNSSPLIKVTIIPRAKGALGFAQYLPDELNLYSKDQLEDMMVMALGGRVAEEIFFNRITTGASDDIKKVTQIAGALVTQYGMSPALGCVNYGGEEGYQKSFSEETGSIIDGEVRKIIDKAYERCKIILNEKKELVQKLGDSLLLKETMALPDIVEVLGQRPYPLKASLLEYLEELKDRRVEEDILAKEEEKKKEQAEGGEPNTTSSDEKKDAEEKK